MSFSGLLRKLLIPFAPSAGPDSSPAECSQELQSESTDSGTEFIWKVARKNLRLCSRCPFLEGNLLRQRNTSTFRVSDSVCVRVCFGSQHKEGVSCHPQGSGIVHAWGGPIILFFFHLNELLSCPPLISGVWQRVIEGQSPRKWSLFTQPNYAGPTAACLWFIGPKIPSSGNNNALKLQTPLPHRTQTGQPKPRRDRRHPANISINTTRVSKEYRTPQG